jgi:RNA polymerase sigma-70 factor, ECF subfamily
MNQHMAVMPMSANANHIPTSEAALIRMCLEGASQAFSELVRPYRPIFYKKALSIVRNEADAEDVTQTALLKAFRKLSQFRLDSQFRTWVTSIVINEALMCLRASRRVKQESLDREEREDGSSAIDIADVREKPVPCPGKKATASGDPPSCFSPAGAS